MPGMGGLVLIDRIRKEGAPPPDLLVMTGKLTTEVQSTAAAAGLPAVLARPLDPAQGLAAVRLSLSL